MNAAGKYQNEDSEPCPVMDHEMDGASGQGCYSALPRVATFCERDYLSALIPCRPYEVSFAVKNTTSASGKALAQ